jgi:hypothetical protein
VHYLFAESGGEIRGVLPLARQRSLLLGDALISTPFCVYGGVAAAEPAARAALEQAALELAGRLGVAHVEFRNLSPRREDWVRRSSHATFRKPITADAGENLLAIPRKQRAEVRKGIERGLSAKASPDAGRCWDLCECAPAARRSRPAILRRSRARSGNDCEFAAIGTASRWRRC